MSDFSGNTREVKAVRKSHECEQCGKKIEAGSPAKYAFGIWQGYAYSTYTHPECNAAAREYADINDAWGEEYPWFQHMDDTDHHSWLLEKHPVVAARLGVMAGESE